MSMVWFAGDMVAGGKDVEEMDPVVSLKTHRSSSPMHSALGAEGVGSPSAAVLKKRKIVNGPRTPELGCRRAMR